MNAVFAQGKDLEHNPWNGGFIENLELATTSAVFTVSQPTITSGFWSKVFMQTQGKGKCIFFAFTLSQASSSAYPMTAPRRTKIIGWCWNFFQDKTAAACPFLLRGTDARPEKSEWHQGNRFLAGKLQFYPLKLSFLGQTMSRWCCLWKIESPSNTNSEYIA